MKNSDRRKFNKGIIFYLLEQRQNFYTIWHSKSSTGPIWSISIIFIHFQPISATAAGQTSCMNDLKKFSPPSLVINLTLTLVKVSLYFCSGPVINWCIYALRRMRDLYIIVVCGVLQYEASMWQYCCNIH